MTQKVTLHYAGMVGQGYNAQDAKDDAVRRAAAALSGNYTPEVLNYRRELVLLFRTPQGWQYQALIDERGRPVIGRLDGAAAYPTRTEAVRFANLYLAQRGWQAEDGAAAPSFIQQDKDREQFTAWAGRQLAYPAGPDVSSDTVS